MGFDDELFVSLINELDATEKDMKQTVFFDLFETLVTQQVPDRPTGRYIAQELGLDPAQLEEGWRAIVNDRMTGRIPDYPSALREICRRAGHSISNAQVNNLTEDRLQRDCPYVS